ncbi:MAG: hypothetical protein QOD38_2371 [Acidimicrobiaceae bacterium]
MSTTEAEEEAPKEEPEEQEPELEPKSKSKRVVRNPALLIVSIAAVVFAVLAIVMVAIVVTDRSKSNDSGDRTEISTTAARIAEAITAVEPSGGGALAATVEQLGTSPVIAQYTEISDAMRKVMGPLKLQSIRGTVKEVYVGNIEGSEARVIVRLDLVYVGDNTRVIPDQYLDMTLAKLDGQWKVDNVQVLNVALAGAAPTSTVPGSQPTTPSTASSSG